MTPEIKKLKGNDINLFVELIRLFEDVFEMKPFSLPSKDYLQDLLLKPDFFVFVALADNKVVGGLTVYTLHQYYTTRPLAYIYDLAIARQSQRQGISKKLIVAANHYCKEKGYEEVFVQADKVDDYALDFYRSTTPTAEEQTVHYFYKLDDFF